MARYHRSAALVFFLRGAAVPAAAAGAAFLLPPSTEFFAVRTSTGGTIRPSRKRVIPSSPLPFLAAAGSGGINGDAGQNDVPDQQQQHQEQFDVIIGPGSSLSIPDGVLSFPRTLLVEGSIIGRIDCAAQKHDETANGDSGSGGSTSIGTKVRVAKGGTIEGDVACAETVEVLGRIVGKIECKFLTIVAGAEVVGDVTCGSLFLEPGATVLGIIRCGTAVEDEALTVSQEEHAAHASSSISAPAPADDDAVDKSSRSAGKFHQDYDNTLAAAIGRMGRGRKTDVGKEKKTGHVVMEDKNGHMVEGKDVGERTIFLGRKDKVNGIRHTHSSGADGLINGEGKNIEYNNHEQVNGHADTLPEHVNADSGVPFNIPINGDGYAPDVNVNGDSRSGDSYSPRFQDDGEILAYLRNAPPPLKEYVLPAENKYVPPPVENEYATPAENEYAQPHLKAESAPPPAEKEYVPTSVVSAPHQSPVIEEVASYKTETGPAQDIGPPPAPYKHEDIPRVLDKNGKIATQATLDAIKEKYERESDEPFYVDNFGNPLYRSANEDEVNTLKQNRDLLNDHRKVMDEYLQEKRHSKIDERQKALLDASDAAFRRHNELRWDRDGQEIGNESADSYVPDFLRGDSS